MRALISVSAKDGLDAFARGLHELGVAIVSTGNTAKALAQAGIPVSKVSDLTGFPEILDGRVKTLHPNIHGGILARRDLPEHMDTIKAHGIGPIDLVVVNLYPFQQTVARPDVTFEDAIENIDIGGPSMVRSAAKNHQDVLVVVDPADYVPVLDALRANAVTPELRRRLAAKAFSHTSAYDAAITQYLGGDALPATLNVGLPKAQELRYGENPHQQAALYGDFGQFFETLHGKELSYINILDIAAAQELTEEFPAAEGCALTIVKHTNPCGVGVGATQLEAWEAAFATDREAPFGGVIAINHPMELSLAQAIDELFTEILIAPDFTPEALELLRKKKNRRLVRALRPVSAERRLMLHSVPGGLLAQEWDRAPLAGEEWQVVTKRAPTPSEELAMRFGWRVVKHVKSNAIVYVGADRTLGVGAGQMSRVDSSRVAVEKAARAGLSLQGCAIASDALFPFPDGVEVAAAAGATAVIQPGGSVRDDAVIAAADRLGLAMVFTGRRHFRH
ncbi:bifunctional phosphoribosylaminoimidazolecarboxamide formyltransferase/IMP cyclohydrolase [Chloroflexia bacterium SDU3-3]|nr:bifunctional phosphoribosylaminoimidazolecarboxamide formyltransferase/IMP cyclohydrolase [Chloroflexia bacterium SDU3-3]